MRSTVPGVWSWSPGILCPWYNQRKARKRAWRIERRRPDESRRNRGGSPDHQMGLLSLDPEPAKEHRPESVWNGESAAVGSDWADFSLHQRTLAALGIERDPQIQARHYMATTHQTRTARSKSRVLAPNRIDAVIGAPKSTKSSKGKGQCARPRHKVRGTGPRDWRCHLEMWTSGTREHWEAAGPAAPRRPWNRAATACGLCQERFPSYVDACAP